MWTMILRSEQLSSKYHHGGFSWKYWKPSFLTNCTLLGTWKPSESMPIWTPTSSICRWSTGSGLACLVRCTRNIRRNTPTFAQYLKGLQWSLARRSSGKTVDVRVWVLWKSRSLGRQNTFIWVVRVLSQSISLNPGTLQDSLFCHFSMIFYPLL